MMLFRPLWLMFVGTDEVGIEAAVKPRGVHLAVPSVPMIVGMASFAVAPGPEALSAISCLCGDGVWSRERPSCLALCALREEAGPN